MIYYIIIVIGALSRLVPHLDNFTAIGAIALFSGYYIKDTKKAILIPLTALIVTDFFIGFYDWKLLLSVYASFVLVVLLGSLIKKKTWLFAMPTSIIGTVLFFIVTNWAFWQFATFYPKTIDGLVSCYIAGIPFLKNSLMGDLLYTFAIFSLAEMAVMLKERTNNAYMNLRLE